MVRFLQAMASPTWRNRLRITSEIILKISTILSNTKKKQKNKKLHHLSDMKKKIEWKKRIISIEYKDPQRTTQDKGPWSTTFSMSITSIHNGSSYRIHAMEQRTQESIRYQNTHLTRHNVLEKFILKFTTKLQSYGSCALSTLNHLFPKPHQFILNCL